LPLVDQSLRIPRTNLQLDAILPHTGHKSYETFNCSERLKS
jgi:hypothetical protein